MNNTSAALKWFRHHVHFGGSLQDSGLPGTVQLSLSPRWLWLLFTDDRLLLCIFFVASVLKGKIFELLKKKKILLDNCLTGKWSARICSETSTRRCINHCTSQYVLNQQVCLPWKKTPLQSLHFYFYFFTVYTVIFKSYKYGQPLYWAWSVTINLLL